MSKYLRDTNICIYIANYKPLSVLEKFKQLEVNEVAMLIITLSELTVGAEKSQQKQATVQKLMNLSEIIPLIALSSKIG
ncbi:MAG: PIN domain-containing protein [Gammaproteobacteria bacterium]|nr:PIN domain-containing protein [Gammaproteobacteria bacterium]